VPRRLALDGEGANLRLSCLDPLGVLLGCGLCEAGLLLDLSDILVNGSLLGLLEVEPHQRLKLVEEIGDLLELLGHRLDELEDLIVDRWARALEQAHDLLIGAVDLLDGGDDARGDGEVFRHVDLRLGEWTSTRLTIGWVCRVGITSG
jgi:hypothetical protein